MEMLFDGELTMLTTELHQGTTEQEGQSWAEGSLCSHLRQCAGDKLSPASCGRTVCLFSWGFLLLGLLWWLSHLRLLLLLSFYFVLFLFLLFVFLFLLFFLLLFFFLWFVHWRLGQRS